MVQLLMIIFCTTPQQPFYYRFRYLLLTLCNRFLAICIKRAFCFRHYCNLSHSSKHSLLLTSAKYTNRNLRYEAFCVYDRRYMPQLKRSKHHASAAQCPSNAVWNTRHAACRGSRITWDADGRISTTIEHAPWAVRNASRRNATSEPTRNDGWGTANGWGAANGWVSLWFHGSNSKRNSNLRVDYSSSIVTKSAKCRCESATKYLQQVSRID